MIFDVLYLLKMRPKNAKSLESLATFLEIGAKSQNKFSIPLIEASWLLVCIKAVALNREGSDVDALSWPAVPLFTISTGLVEEASKEVKMKIRLIVD